MQGPDFPQVVDIDIVSDVVCPWCIVGFLQFRQGLAMTGMGARVRWHPFELNPDMAPGGQDLFEHIAEKYGASPEQSRLTRDRLTEIGAALGFHFGFSDSSRIVNTFHAHQLLDWAAAQGKQHPLKMALFAAYFSDQLDVSQLDTLVAVAAKVGLDAEAARQVLDAGSQAQSVRDKQAFWRSNGVNAVPTMCIGGRYVLNGAQEPATYAEAIRAASGMALNADPA